MINILVLILYFSKSKVDLLQTLKCISTKEQIRECFNTDVTNASLHITCNPRKQRNMDDKVPRIPSGSCGVVV